MEKELETLEFGTSELAMLIFNVLNKWKGIEEVMSEVCEACQLGKEARHPFLVQTTHVSSKPLEMIRSYVWTTKTKSIGGCKYYVSFIDDHTRKVWVYFMRHKGEVFQHFLISKQW